MNQDRIVHIPDARDNRIIVISDIHGHHSLLEVMIDRLELTDRDFLIILGDFINRGTDSLKTYEYVKALSSRKNTLVMKGNHEYWMQACFTDPSHSEKLLGFFLSELLLYSGQYALFYILMNFSKSGMAMFQYKAHTILLLGLILQTFVLSRYGSNVKYRILGSLICPIIYTFVEIEEFKDFILNIGHFFFWGFSLSIGILNAAKLKFKKSIRSILEFVTVFTNVIVFVFIYMYFDLLLSISTETNAGIVEYHHYLSVLNLPGAISDFIGDQAHVYITLGGIILGISLGLSQLRVLQLKERINDLFGKYIDASIRDRIIANNGYIEEKQELCILFSDIRNFTNISENASSEKLIKALNAYFSLWESEVSKHDGIINKYIGDAVMVIFGLEDPECKETLQDLIISEAVYIRAHADIQKKFTYLDAIALKGKSVQVDVYTTNAASN